jgi:hypothetical protein
MTERPENQATAEARRDPTAGAPANPLNDVIGDREDQATAEARRDPTAGAPANPLNDVIGGREDQATAEARRDPTAGAPPILRSNATRGQADRPIAPPAIAMPVIGEGETSSPPPDVRPLDHVHGHAVGEPLPLPSDNETGWR